MPDRERKPVRAVRKAAAESARPGWRGLIQGLIEIDADAAYEKIASYLRSSGRGNLSAAEIDGLLDESADIGHLSDRLASKARRDYELAKERHEVWLESKRTASRQHLEAEKQRGSLKKQISNDMVLDYIRASWPAEYQERVARLKDFQAAVHTLEALPDRCRDRRNSLAKLADTAMARGARR